MTGVQRGFKRAAHKRRPLTDTRVICGPAPWLRARADADAARKPEQPTRRKLGHTGEINPQNRLHKQEQSQREPPSNRMLSTAAPTATDNGTSPTLPTSKSHNWEFLVAVLVTAISISIVIALIAKCQVIRRYLDSYRHTRLRETDTISQCDPSGCGLHNMLMSFCFQHELSYEICNAFVLLSKHFNKNKNLSAGALRKLL